MRRRSGNRSGAGARVLALVLVAACGRAPEPGGSGADEPLPGVDERLDRWARSPAGTAVPVALGFREVSSDSAVVALLQRHGLVPYAVHMVVAGRTGVHGGTRARASLEVLSAAREDAVTRLRIALCGLQGRARELVARPGPGLRAGRTLLSDVQAIRSALPEVELGAPIVYGVQAVGLLPEVVAARADPAVASYQPGVPQEDTVLVPAPPFPETLPPIGADLATLPPERVEAAIAELAETTSPCEDGARGP